MTEEMDYEKQYYALSAKIKILQVDEENLLMSVVQSKAKIESLRNDIGNIINAIIEKKKVISDPSLFPVNSENVESMTPGTNDTLDYRSPLSESKDRKRKTRNQREPVLKKPRRDYNEDDSKYAESESKTDLSDNEHKNLSENESSNKLSQ
ncbi:hypothetical protein WA158_008067 [Blastocystis sp. Blastoise]